MTQQFRSARNHLRSRWLGFQGQSVRQSAGWRGYQRPVKGVPRSRRRARPLFVTGQIYCLLHLALAFSQQYAYKALTQITNLGGQKANNWNRSHFTEVPENRALTSARTPALRRFPGSRALLLRPQPARSKRGVSRKPRCPAGRATQPNRPLALRPLPARTDALSLQPAAQARIRFGCLMVPVGGGHAPASTK